MTTIAYKNGIIAYDSRQTRNDTIVDDDREKKIVRDGVVFIFCGTPAEFDDLIAEYFGNSSRDEYNSHGIVFDKGKLYHFSKTKDDGLCKHPLDPMKQFAIGSGEDHAWTAMDCGLCAIDAIEKAKLRDTGTGGKVRSYSITPMIDG
jgi:ATP-dependent protease HslVU (ClpYQ) peptidase subunit